MDFFISDTHFYGIRNFGEDKFKSHEEREAAIIRNWQETVKSSDNVYILGDFCDASDVNTWKNLVSQLPGKLFLVRGNHETEFMPKEAEGLFEFVKDYAEVKTSNGYTLILCHYPIICHKWGSRNDVIHLHGHVHMTKEGKMVELFKNFLKEEVQKSKDIYLSKGNLYNVGCMCPWIDYTPRTLQEILSAEINAEDYDYPYQIY